LVGFNSCKLHISESRKGRQKGKVRHFFGAMMDRVVVDGGEALWRFRQALKWPFVRLGWGIQRLFIWPIQDGFERPGGVLALGAVVLLVAAGAAGAVLLNSPDRSASPVAIETAAPVKPAADLEAVAPKPTAEPTLHGAKPVFEPGKGKASRIDPPKRIASSAPSSQGPSSSSSAAGATIASEPAAGTSALAARPAGPPAGPAAVAVAREFASAFVVYETGGEESKVREALGKTATPELSRSLLRRPPRLPDGVQVPKAKVLNVVPGPSQGRVYSVSVSLLRVGVTSELRLDMERVKRDGWRVTNVLG
jgi:hypothetical protein